MIGVFDSGSGGLTILAALQKQLPNEDFLYLGDHARTPYGERAEEEIIAMSKEMVEVLFDKGCSLVILACNTASTIALRELQENWLPHTHPDKRILGVHIPVVEALTGLTWDRAATTKNLDHKGGTVVVFATSKTVASGTYSRQVNLRTANYTIVEQACPHLAQTIENDKNRDNIDSLVKAYVDEAIEKCANMPNAVILGCTHYPLVEDLFKKHLPAGIEILNQPLIVARALQVYLAKHKNMTSTNPNGKLVFLTTGTPNEIHPFKVHGLSQPVQFQKL
ncbi:MAG: glutamate racemase [Sphingomonadales bacterium]|nr:glutamate racemase [Sphingomonadales bacterium]